MLLVNKDLHNVHARSFNDEEPLLFYYFFCKAVSNVGPYGLFWQPACQGYVPLTLDVVRVAVKVPLAFHTPL